MNGSGGLAVLAGVALLFSAPSARAATAPETAVFLLQLAGPLDSVRVNRAESIRLTFAREDAARRSTLGRDRASWRWEGTQLTVAAPSGSLPVGRDVLRIEASEGTYRGRGALIGMAAGAVCGALVVASEDASGDVDSPTIGPLIAGAIASLGSAFIGAIVGSTVGRCLRAYHECYTAP